MTNSAYLSGGRKPGAVLFLCNRNSIRSPMAEAIAQHLQLGIQGPQTFVDSAGIDPDEVNGFAIRVLNAWDIPLERHVSKSLDDVSPSEFDIVVSLAKGVRDYVGAHVDLGSAEHLFWDIADPNAGNLANQGNPAERAKAFEAVRDELKQRISALLH